MTVEPRPPAAPNASSRLKFTLASLRENKSDEKPRSNFPLNPGPQFTPTGGVLSAHNMLLQKGTVDVTVLDGMERPIEN